MYQFTFEWIWTNVQIGGYAHVSGVSVEHVTHKLAFQWLVGEDR